MQAVLFMFFQKLINKDIGVSGLKGNDSSVKFGS